MRNANTSDNGANLSHGLWILQRQDEERAELKTRVETQDGKIQRHHEEQAELKARVETQDSKIEVRTFVTFLSFSLNG